MRLSMIYFVCHTEALFLKADLFDERKKRDRRGRVLRFGESQRSDGRYAYKYQDNDGSFNLR